MKEIEKFYNEIKNINYGWYDKKGNLHKKLKGENFSKLYRMQKIKDIRKNNYAICWEMCELERLYFKSKNIHHKTIFALLKEDKRFPCHTFLVFNLNDKWYWFEASWDKKKGIYEYQSLEEILNYIKDNFEDFAGREYNKEKIEFYEYKKSLIRPNCNMFYYNCLHGKKLKY